MVTKCKNLWCLVKMKLYKDVKHYNSKGDLWEPVKTTMSENEFTEINMKKKE